MTYEKVYHDKVCVVCNKNFTTSNSTKLSCSRECQKKQRKEWHEGKRKRSDWDRSPRVCIHCNSVYTPIAVHQKYCNKKCGEEYWKKNNSYVKTGPFEEKRCCKNCGKEYTARAVNKRFCSTECREIAVKEEKILKKEKLLKEGCSIYTPSHFDNLTFYNEDQFHHWFNENFSLFGLKKIHKSNTRFPDIIAETYNGKVLRIELEYFASNFEAHEHNAELCDLIICYVKKETVKSIKGLPIISMFDIPPGKENNWEIVNMNNKSLSCYFINIVNSLNNNLENYMRTNIDCQHIELCDYIQQYAKISA